MIREQMEYKEIPVLKKITCDICKKECDADNDWEEVEEFLMINRNCGFNSIFGKESIITIDMCQQCLKNKLGKYIRVKESDNVEKEKKE